MNIKLIASILALIVAFIFNFFSPGSGIETVVVGALTALGGWLGIDWRKQYDEIKSWLASKTIWGALLIAIPALALILAPVFSFAIPEQIATVLEWIVAGGGFLFFAGFSHAILKKSKIGK